MAGPSRDALPGRPAPASALLQYPEGSGTNRTQNDAEMSQIGCLNEPGPGTLYPLGGGSLIRRPTCEGGASVLIWGGEFSRAVGAQREPIRQGHRWTECWRRAQDHRITEGAAESRRRSAAKACRDGARGRTQRQVVIC